MVFLYVSFCCKVIGACRKWSSALDSTPQITVEWGPHGTSLCMEFQDPNVFNEMMK